jgi:hypothetical protein
MSRTTSCRSLRCAGLHGKDRQDGDDEQCNSFHFVLLGSDAAAVVATSLQ